MDSQVKVIVFWAVIILSAVLLWQVVRQANPKPQNAPEISYSDFMGQVSSGNVAAIRIARTKANGTYRNGGSFRVVVPASQEQMLAALQQRGVEVWYSDAEDANTASWLTNLLPLGLLAALWFFMIQKMQAKNKAARRDAGGGQIPPAPIG